MLSGRWHTSAMSWTIAAMSATMNEPATSRNCRARRSATTASRCGIRRASGPGHSKLTRSSCASVDAPANALFSYLSDIGNLPKYFSRMTSAEPAGEEAVRTTATELDGRTVEGEAWFRVNQNARRIEWGSEGPNDYHGWLEVQGDSERSTVAVHLSTQRVANGEVDQGIEETLQKIKRLVEQAGAPSRMG